MDDLITERVATEVAHLNGFSGIAVYLLIGVLVSLIASVILLRNGIYESDNDNLPFVMVLIILMWPVVVKVVVILGFVAGTICGVLWCAKQTADWLIRRAER